ncbi:MAG: hypothetical protein Q8L41_04755 [Anaerolineales bacterium]|nr:hypothetical protein [Anaerolineales bacterium]
MRKHLFIMLTALCLLTSAAWTDIPSFTPSPTTTFTHIITFTPTFTFTLTITATPTFAVTHLRSDDYRQ